MAPTLQISPIVPRATLEQLAEARMREAQALLRVGEYAGAVYLAGYALECYLKVAICARLDWESLLATFKTHDLERLLLFTGLEKRLKDDVSVWLNFKRVVGLWSDGSGNPSVRYRHPEEILKSTAEEFLDWLTVVPEGLIPWLQKAIS